MKTKKELATFALGCFWQPQILFDGLLGVISTSVGYTGGKKEYANPTYEQVCTGKTGHAEAIQIEFDSAKITFEELLKIFWKNHNPTTKNKQGPDIGSQYRSVIFYHNQKQKEFAEKTLKEEQKNWKGQIVTEIVPAKEFYKAEDYHQNYLKKRGLSSCHI